MTEAFVAICKIQTSATVFARKGVTLIYVLFTLCSFKSWVTLTLKASNFVKTLSMFTTGFWMAIIDVDPTIFTCPAIWTFTFVGVNVIITFTNPTDILEIHMFRFYFALFLYRIFSTYWLEGTLINICLAKFSFVAWLTPALKSINKISTVSTILAWRGCTFIYIGLTMWT